MTSLFTIIPKKYIDRHDKLFTFYVDEFMHGRGRISSSSRKGNRCSNEMTIADILDNVNILLNDNYQSPSNVELFIHHILGMCFKHKPIDEIINYIVKNIK